MAQQVEITAYVYEVEFGGEKAYRVFNTDNMSDRWYSLIGPAQFTYEIPDSFNPTAAKLAALEAQKQEVRAAYLAKVREIEKRISELQAIEYVAEAV